MWFKDAVLMEIKLVYHRWKRNLFHSHRPSFSINTKLQPPEKDMIILTPNVLHVEHRHMEDEDNSF